MARIIRKRDSTRAAAPSSTTRPLACYEIGRDLCRNARLIPEGREPSFLDAFVVPRGSTRLEVETRRCRVTLRFR